jgi:hypothetical protein
MARWNDDGSCAPTARVRSGKGEPFSLTLTKQEIEDDVAVFDSEVRTPLRARGPRAFCRQRRWLWPRPQQ